MEGVNPKRYAKPPRGGGHDLTSELAAEQSECLKFHEAKGKCKKVSRENSKVARPRVVSIRTIQASQNYFTGCAPSVAYAVKHDYHGGQKVAELRRRKVLWVPLRNPRVRIRHHLRSRQSTRLHQRQPRTSVNGSLVALLL